MPPPATEVLGKRTVDCEHICKTKIIVLSAGISQTKNGHFGGEFASECLSPYTYLVLIVSSNGNLLKLEDDMINKAGKASFVIRQTISSSHHISTKITPTNWSYPPA